MLDLWQNAIVTGIVGALILFVLTMATWAVRRTFHRQDRDIDNQDRKIATQDREIEKMQDTQKEIGRKLAGVLERENVLSAKLESGMESVDLKFENMGLTFNKDLGVLAANVDKDIKALATSMDKDIQTLATNVDKDIQTLATNVDKDIVALRHSFSEMKASVGAHREVVDRDLAEVREWLKGDGTWPGRSNGKG